jgi:hypothetical protein
MLILKTDSAANQESRLNVIYNQIVPIKHYNIEKPA